MKTFIAIMGWGVAVITGIIGYAVVQHETQLRDSDIKTLTRQRDEIQMKLTTARDEANRKLAKIGDLTDQLKSAYDISIASKDAEIEAEKRLNSALKGKIAGMETLPTPATDPVITQRTMISSSAPIVTEANISLPAWVPPQRYMMEKLIRTRAEKEWKDNYAMIEHEIARQSKSLNRLVELNRWVGNREILAKAAKEWGDNYAMMEHEFDRQADAKKRLGQ